MSFRTRLTTFFLMIVIVPMVGVGALVLRLIADGQQAKVDARASGLATSAQSLYTHQSDIAMADARAIAMNATLRPGPRLDAQLGRVRARTGLARIVVRQGGRILADIGDHTAVAPGEARASGASGGDITVWVSQLRAADYAADLTGKGVGVVVRGGGRTLAATPIDAGSLRFGSHGGVSVDGDSYRYLTQRFHGFAGQRVRVTVLSNTAASSSNTGSNRLVAAVFIAGFLLLAFAFSVLASRALEGQLGRFLQAARRLASGDFSASVPIEGRDDFAALGSEFNNMSAQLAHRLDELSEERRRLRESIRRIGETFASGLDRQAVLELALRSSMDAVRADSGRLTVRREAEGRLVEILRLGTLEGFEEQFLEAERGALRTASFGEATSDSCGVAAITLGSPDAGGPVQALITVCRGSAGFSDDDRDLLRSLASQATLALENIQLHVQVQRQAVTDELTGLVNHGRFQELLSGEIGQVRRYHHHVGLIMLDLDNFKRVNDTYGHQQGDVVLKQVARVLRESSRDADSPARYGGEELALILPHTDLEGTYAIAERVRQAIEHLRIPRLDHKGELQVTASVGVAAASSGDKDSLIAEADSALYAAKRAGKNRTVRAPIVAAEVAAGE